MIWNDTKPNETDILTALSPSLSLCHSHSPSLLPFLPSRLCKFSFSLQKWYIRFSSSCLWVFFSESAVITSQLWVRKNDRLSLTSRIKINTFLLWQWLKIESNSHYAHKHTHTQRTVIALDKNRPNFVCYDTQISHADRQTKSMPNFWLCLLLFIAKKESKKKKKKKQLEKASQRKNVPRCGFT